MADDINHRITNLEPDWGGKWILQLETEHLWNWNYSASTQHCWLFLQFWSWRLTSSHQQLPCFHLWPKQHWKWLPAKSTSPSLALSQTPIEMFRLLSFLVSLHPPLLSTVKPPRRTVATIALLDVCLSCCGNYDVWRHGDGSRDNISCSVQQHMSYTLGWLLVYGSVLGVGGCLLQSMDLENWSDRESQMAMSQKITWWSHW